MTIDDSDARRLSQALLQLYKPDLGSANFAERSCTFLAALVPAELIVFGSLNRRTRHLELYADRPAPDFAVAMEAFGRHMSQLRTFSWDPTMHGGRPFFLSDYHSVREFRSTGMYSEVYRKLGIDNHCAALIPGVEREVAFYGIERKGGTDFREQDRALLAMAQSHLGNARELAWARDELDGAADPAVLQRQGLTSREAETLRWIAEGKSNDEIALLMRLKLFTVKGYVKTIFQKIGAPNRLAAALWALRATRVAECSEAGDAPRRVRVAVGGC